MHLSAMFCHLLRLYGNHRDPVSIDDLRFIALQREAEGDGKTQTEIDDYEWN